MFKYLIISVFITCYMNYSYRFYHINYINNKYDHNIAIYSSKKPKQLSETTNNYIKIKRLKQLQSEGKNYTSYIEEQQRIQSKDETENKLLEEYIDTKDNIVKSDDINKKITDYIFHKQLREKTRYIYKSVFLPDCSVNSSIRWFYNEIINQTNNNLYIGINVNCSVVNMPNIHDFNTKRYEILWFYYMRELNLTNYHTIIAHGSSAEAILRYAETDKLNNSKVILIDPTDIYTAGERHGRAFYYYHIVNNIGNISIVNTNSNKETESLFNKLYEYDQTARYINSSPSLNLDAVETILWIDRLRKVIDGEIKYEETSKNNQNQS